MLPESNWFPLESRKAVLLLCGSVMFPFADAAHCPSVIVHVVLSSSTNSRMHFCCRLIAEISSLTKSSDFLVSYIFPQSKGHLQSHYTYDVGSVSCLRLIYSLNSVFFIYTSSAVTKTTIIAFFNLDSNSERDGKGNNVLQALIQRNGMIREQYCSCL